MSTPFKKQKFKENMEESDKVESDNKKRVQAIMLRKLKAKLLQRRSELTRMPYSPISWVSIPDLPKTSLIPDETVPVIPIKNDGIDIDASQLDQDGYIPLPKPDYSWYTKKESVSSVNESPENFHVLSEDGLDEHFSDLELLDCVTSNDGANISVPNLEVIEISDCSSGSEDVISPSPIKNVTDGLQSDYLQSVEKPSSSRMSSKCPVCLEEFPLSMQQTDSDAHIAQCLQQSTEDVEW